MVHIAFFWHHHQPYYKDLATGEYLMPWVRLHGIKDYIGMIAILEEFPEMRQTFNFVPCLLEQIQDYADGNGRDKFWILSEKPVGDLSEDEKLFILDNFFAANWPNMINVYPRYRTLLQKRNFSRRRASEVSKFFTEKDVRDLQVWANLAWFHPIITQQDETLKGLFAKGADFSEEDKKTVLAKELEIMQKIIPYYKRMHDAGQIELTTSPLYHPILPLLCDARRAREALPHIRLPGKMVSAKEDAKVQVERAILMHERFFGSKPLGMWPSEGAVSDDIIPMLAQAGIKWAASDEEILARSLGVNIHRDGGGNVTAPEMLYKPYQVSTGGHQINMVFRDHNISDLIGFQYSRMESRTAVSDFLKRIDFIKRHKGNKPILVSIILDGENAWEYYPNSGLDFLRGLYRVLVNDKDIKTVRIGDYLKEYPPTETLRTLFSGSWIGHNLATWVGHEEKNKAWESVAEARSFLTRQLSSLDSSLAIKAWEELYIAEGSDWFWWYGDDHSSAYDNEFDKLFRKHVKNIYKFLGKDYPKGLDAPIARVGRKKPYTSPKGFLNIKLDGKSSSYFEWIAASHYDAEKDAGAMKRVSGWIIKEIFFGFDISRFFMRIDFFKDVIGKLTANDSIIINFLTPTEIRFRIPGPLQKVMDIELIENGTNSAKKIPHCVAVDEILELCSSFSELGLQPGMAVEFFVEIERDKEIIQRAPVDTVFTFEVPSKDFEEVMWQV
ncbi:MAG TPA: glycoside hydrolase family 57 protein [Candidatus Brocadiales bacterium]|nr:glycoside hydrolase family 57 protein [Candidatus Brocadiales bacterium]